MVNHQYKFVFIHIPKTAGTSMGTALYKACGVEGVYGGLDIHHDDLTEEILRDYFVFTVVRNPWDRMYSQYKYRKFLHILPFEKAVYNLDDYFTVHYSKIPTRPVIPVNKISRAHMFDEFVHLPSQLEFLKGKYNDAINKVPYIDYYARFENLDEDWKVICEKIGIEHVPFPHKNKSRDEQTAFHTDYRSVYSKETEEFIRKKYIDDVEVFKYEF